MASSSTQTPNFPISPIGSWLFWFLPHSVVLLMKLQAEGEGHALAPGPGSGIDSRLQGWAAGRSSPWGDLLAGTSGVTPWHRKWLVCSVAATHSTTLLKKVSWSEMLGMQRVCIPGVQGPELRVVVVLRS